MRTVTRQSVLALLCLSVIAWSFAPVLSHAPDWAATAHDDPDTVVEHDHPHGLLEALLWVLHSHGHDVADHDHTQGMPVVARSDGAMMDGGSPQPFPETAKSTPIFRIERPPRV